MDFTGFTDSFTQMELAALLVVATVVGVFLGPGAISVEGANSMWIEAASAAIMGMLVFVVGALSLWAAKSA